MRISMTASSLLLLAAGACGGAGAGAQAAQGKPGLEADFVGNWNDPRPDYPVRAVQAHDTAARRAALHNPDAPAIAITGGTVLTAAGRRFSPGLVILEGGAISYVGAARGREIPRGAVVIDASGKTVTPGLIDAHSHIAPTATR